MMKFTLVFRVSLTVILLVALSVPAAASASETSPAFARAQGKGQALMERGQYQAAIKHLKKAERLAGEPSVQLLLDLALCSNNVGELTEAETYARRSLEAASEPVDRARAYNRLGISLFSLVQMHLDLRGNTKADRRSGALGSQQAASRSLQRVLGEAESAFRKILELTGGQASIAWYSLGETLKLQGRRQEADAAFAEYLERSPDGASAAAARRALAWTACVGAASGSESPGDGSAGSGPAVPFEVGGDVLPPVKIQTPQPSYNDRARAARIQGTMLFEAIIDENGDVRCVDVVKGLPMGLSEDAVRVVSRWKYRPATRHGEPVVVRFRVIITMSIG